MPDTAALDTLLVARVTAIGLAKTESGLPLRGTIRPVQDEALTLEQKPESADALPDLPRLSVDDRDARTLGRPGPGEGARPDFAIVSTLGEGGMGRVRLARQRSLDRDVALKTLKEDATHAVFHALLREARITGSLEHPGVIPVHALGLDAQGKPMLVMKRVDGVDLGALLHDDAHPAWKTRSADRLVACLEMLIQVCLTVEFAHSRGVIHRDIKPENIMVGSFGEVYLLDWGIATKKADAGEGGLVGTPVYMAPEMALGQTIDERTDVYLLGATLHEVLTGRARHDGATIMDVLRSATLSAPVAYGPDVPERLANVVNRATSLEPEHRQASARLLREELADFIRHRSARALSDAALERLTALERELAAAGTGPPADLARAFRLAAEARFGLTQSLREHGGDGDARTGMRRCIAAAVDLELRQEHIDSAVALYREMEPPDAKLASRIEEVRAKCEARAAEQERLRSLAHDLDPTEQASKRTMPLVFIAIVLSLIGVAIRLTQRHMSPEVLAIAGLGGTVVLSSALLTVRQRVLTNAFNRRIATVMLLGMVGAFSNRLIGLLTRAAPAHTLTIDLLVFAVIAAVAAVTMFRPLWICAGLFLAGVMAGALWPPYIIETFSVTSIFANFAGAVVLARARRPE